MSVHCPQTFPPAWDTDVASFRSFLVKNDHIPAGNPQDVSTVKKTPPETPVNRFWTVRKCCYHRIPSLFCQNRADQK
jgi:hypothetical protein